jgi:hypothetical protein
MAAVQSNAQSWLLQSENISTEVVRRPSMLQSFADVERDMTDSERDGDSLGEYGQRALVIMLQSSSVTVLAGYLQRKVAVKNDMILVLSAIK